MTSVGIQYIPRSSVIKNADIIDSYKILIGRLVPSNGELDVDPKDGYKVITDTRIIGPGQINTETYLDIGVFPTEEEAVNFEKFLHCKFTRFLLQASYIVVECYERMFQICTPRKFQRVLDRRKVDIKNMVCQKKKLLFVESMIRPME